MSKFKQMADRLRKKVAELESTRAENTLILMHDVFALLANRIQNTGIGPDGTPFPGYSTKEHPWAVALLNPQNFNAPGKIEKFKKDVAKGKLPASYKALRKAYGLTDSKRTLTFDGDMFKSIGPQIIEDSNGKTVIVLKGNNKKTDDKIKGNSYNAKVNILKLSKDEIDLLRELNTKRIIKILEK